MCWTAIWEFAYALVLCYGLFQKKTKHWTTGGDGDDKKFSGGGGYIKEIANGICRD